jgi:hypothetical protein
MDMRDFQQDAQESFAAKTPKNIGSDFNRAMLDFRAKADRGSRLLCVFCIRNKGTTRPSFVRITGSKYFSFS